MSETMGGRRIVWRGMMEEKRETCWSRSIILSSSGLAILEIPSRARITWESLSAMVAMPLETSSSRYGWSGVRMTTMRLCVVSLIFSRAGFKRDVVTSSAGFSLEPLIGRAK